jgi:hypothetical protein
VAVATFVALVGMLGVGSSALRRSARHVGSPKGGLAKFSATGRAVAPVPIRPVPRGLGDVGWGFGKVWISTSDGLSDVDPRTGRITASVSLTGCPGCPGAPFAVGMGKIFVTGGGNGTNDVQVVDPSDLSGVQTVIPTQTFNRSQEAFFVATGFTSIWVWPSGRAGCCDGRMFWRIDPSTGERSATWTAPNLEGWDYEHQGHTVAIGAGAAWFLRDGRLWRINPRTNRALGGFTTGASMVATTADAVWTVTDGGVVTEVDPRDFPKQRATVWRHRVPGNIDDLAVRGGQLWLLNDARRILFRVDTRTRTIHATPLNHATPGRLSAAPDTAWLVYPSLLE